MGGQPVVKLRVMTYNVHGLRDDRDALIRSVRAAAPDVIMLQEACGRLRWRTRCARLARSFGLVLAAGGAAAMGNVIMTSLRVRLHDAWALRYPLTPGRHLRGAAFARCSVAGAQFVAVGSHLSIDPAERGAQAARLRRAMAGFPVPVIFGGDVNEEPGGAAWRLLADGLLDTAGGDGSATFPARDGHRRIDAIFADPACGVLGYQVPVSVATRAASDHLPVIADIMLPATGTPSAGEG